jgi:hypothetical protein
VKRDALHSERIQRHTCTVQEAAMTRPQDVVVGMYQKVRAGAMKDARALWADSAVWHLTGTSALAGDYTADEYLSFLRQFLQDYPDYRAEWLDIRTYDDTLLVANLHSTGGPSPGTAGGVLVMRVTDGRVQEGWAIPTVSDRPA